MIIFRNFSCTLLAVTFGLGAASLRRSLSKYHLFACWLCPQCRIRAPFLGVPVPVQSRAGWKCNQFSFPPKVQEAVGWEIA